MDPILIVLFAAAVVVSQITQFLNDREARRTIRDLRERIEALEANAKSGAEKA